jgi:hypothetical protein
VAAGAAAPNAAASTITLPFPLDEPALQSAIQGAHAGDVITFAAPGGTVALTQTLDVPVGVDIEGCSDPNTPGPCVTLKAAGGFDGIDVTAGGATIGGLAVTGAAVGIHVTAGSSSTIGGPSPGQLTVISQSAGAAIQVDGAATGVVVDRVAGAGNGAPFISLAAGANGDAQPPSIVSASATDVVGLGAPGTLVRVYAAPASGSITGLAGSATADATGLWELPMAAAAGELVAATATGQAGSSPLTAAIATVPAAGSRPTATITAPDATVRTQTPTFTLAASDPAAAVLCRVDSDTYALCPGSYQTTALTPGNHTLFARAAGAGGLGPEVSDAFDVDLTPQARIVSGPPRFGRRSSVVFRFAVPAGTTTTQCALDAGRFKACSGRFASGYLLDGRHVFRLRTFNAAGQTTVLETVFTIDTLAPQVSLQTASVRIAASNTAVIITCPPSEPGGCSGSVRLGTIPNKKTHRYREIGTATWTAGPLTSETVSIPVPAWAVAASQIGKGLAMNVVVEARDNAGNVRELRRRGRLLPALPPTGGGGVGTTARRGPA